MSGGGHVFLSYVRENAAEVDHLERVLRGAGLEVWRDTESLWPGEDWRRKIKEAITGNALVFLACFSSESAARTKTHMNEELVVAVDEFRLRPPSTPWLFPVRFDDCALPTYDLGAGRDLDSLQRIDVFGSDRDVAIARLVGAILKQLPESGTPGAVLRDVGDTDARLRQLLRVPDSDIKFEEALSTVADELHSKLSDAEVFPMTDAGIRTNIDMARVTMPRLSEYLDLEAPICTALVSVGTWGRAEHAPAVSRALQRIGASVRDATGLVGLLGLSRFVLLPPVYCGVMAALQRENFSLLPSILQQPQIRLIRGKLPIGAAMNVWWPFEQNELGAQVFAFTMDGQTPTDDDLAELSSGRKGKRYTPVSDGLFAVTRPYFRQLIPDDDDFADLFDRTEILLGVLMADFGATVDGDGYVLRPSVGRFSWRDRYSSVPVEVTMAQEAAAAGSEWGPVKAGLFGGSIERCLAAFDAFNSDAMEARRRRF